MSGLVENTVAAASDGAGPAADRRAVERGRPAGGADPALARDRLVDDAEDRPARGGQRDQGAEQRHAADEGFGAVDRVEHPDEFGVLALAAEFLADDAVLRETAAAISRRIAASAARSAIGDGRQIGLVVDRDRLAEIGADRLSRRVGEVDREGRGASDRRRCPIGSDRTVLLFQTFR